jgi:amino acid adenylation domain-containing protein
MLAGVLERAMAARPDAPAAITRNGSVSMAELNCAANRIAHALLRRLPRSTASVATLLTDPRQQAACLLACLKTGHRFVPIDATFPSERIADILEDSEAAIVAATAAMAGRFRAPALYLDELGDGAAENPGIVSAAANHTWLVYTSGTTGRPKGLIQNHGNLAHYLELYREMFRLTGADRLCTMFSLYVNGGLHDLLIALAHGIPLYAWDARADGVHGLAEWLIDSRVTIYSSVPTVYRQFVAELDPATRFPDLRMVRLWGEGSFRRDFEAFRRHFERGCELINRLGSSETGPYCYQSHGHDSEFETNALPGGFATRGHEVLLLGENGAPAGEGESGEIVVRSRYVSPGYWKREEETAKAFRPDPDDPGVRRYHTGDLGVRLGDGSLVHMGRKDSQVKIRGYRVEPAEIEGALMAHPAVRDALVIAAGEPARLIAYVATRGETQPTVSELRRTVAARLPAYMAPAAFVCLDDFPRAPNGKVARRQLPAPECGRPRQDARFAPPETPEQKKLTAIWEETLRVEGIGIDDEFLDLGGDSLTAARIAARVASEFHVELPPSMLLTAGAVRSLAAAVAAAPAGARAGIPRRAVGAPVSLSAAQVRIWFLDELLGDSAQYVVPFGVRCRGPLDAAALRRALELVLERHEVLRTQFFGVEGRPAARVEARLPLEFGETEAGSEDEAMRQAREFAQRPFRLAVEAKLRALLCRIAADDHLLTVAMHHIACDGVSIGVLFQEVAQAYGGLRLDPLPVQYADFAEWQRERLQPGKLEPLLEYGRRRLSGPLPPLELPQDFLTPAARSYAGGRRSFRIPARLVSRLRRLAVETGATLFHVLLAGYAALLSRLSGQEDFTIGFPAGGRAHVDTESLIGCFINIVVTRLTWDAKASFLDLVRLTREESLAALECQELPFETLIEVLNPDRQMQIPPLFQAFFALQPESMGPPVLPGVESSTVRIGNGASKFSISLYLFESGAELDGYVEFATSLFREETIGRWIGHFVQLLESGASAPSTAVSRLEALRPEERAALVGAQPVEAPAFEAAHVQIAARAAESPDRIAVRSGAGTVTAGELAARAGAIASRLAAMGAGPGSVVGVMVERSADLVAGILGVLEAGAAYLPLDPSLAAPWLSAIVADARPAAVIVDGPAGLSCPVLRLDEVPAAAAFAAVSPAPDDLAYVIYTSGSTGRPKGVEVTHGNLSGFLAAFPKRVGLTGGHRIAAVTTVSFDIAVVELLLPLVCGGTVHLFSRETASDAVLLGRALRESNIDVLHATPATFRMLLDSGWAPGADMTLLCGGEAMPADFPQRLAAATLWNLYGPTETTVWSSAGRCLPGEGFIGAGRPLDGERVYVLDRHRNLQLAGAEGEIWIAGDGVARGYRNAPELTGAKFAADPFVPGARMFRTGDIGRWLADGRLRILGRSDYQVKIRGFRVELEEVDAALRTFPGVCDAATVARPDPAGGNRLVSFVVAAGGARLSPGALRDRVLARLPAYMAPSQCAIVERLPLTASGKVDRAALPEAIGEAPVLPTTPPPRTPVELTLLGIWEQLFGRRGIGFDDNFFEIGGHSLLAARLAAMVEKRLGTGVPLTTLFAAPTIAQLASRLTRDGIPAPLVAAIQPSGSRPPFFCVHAGPLFRALGLRLGLEQPLLGLGFEEARTVEAMAARQLRIMREIQPAGPYYVGGWSMAGTLAYEIARQLQAQGERVGALVLIDAPNYRWLAFETSPARRVVHRLAAHAGLLLRKPPAQWPAHVASTLQTIRFRRSVARLEAEHSGEVREDRLAIALAVRAYRPQPFDGVTLLIRQTARSDWRRMDPLYGWGKLADVKAVDVPGDHRAILVEPSAGLLADAIRPYLAR